MCFNIFKLQNRYSLYVLPTKLLHKFKKNASFYASHNQHTLRPELLKQMSECKYTISTDENSVVTKTVIFIQLVKNLLILN